MTRRHGSGRLRLCILATATLLAAPAWARDSLGLYATWGAFRDPATPRCYALAMAEPSAKRRDYQPYAAIGTWPRRGVRNQVHIRPGITAAAYHAKAPGERRKGGPELGDQALSHGRRRR